MPHAVYDLNRVDKITAGAVGEPGHRVFYIQARKGRRLVTLVVEKEQLAALNQAIDHLLLQLAGDDPRDVAGPDMPSEGGMGLEMPLEPAFRAGQLSLGYDQVSSKVVIVAEELAEEGQDAKPSIARFWAHPAQMRAFSLNAQQAIAAGRPLCAMCGQAIDPAGHFCPRRNGDRKAP
ncbi:MAG TPA: DUF3090 family protein [Anaerolineae bacterium]|nr:DUF3090 family protein [Anaerolineae bacterium]